MHIDQDRHTLRCGELLAVAVCGDLAAVQEPVHLSELGLGQLHGGELLRGHFRSSMSGTMESGLKTTRYWYGLAGTGSTCSTKKVTLSDRPRKCFL